MPVTTSVPYGDGEIVTYHVATPTVTWVDLQELGFTFGKQSSVWTLFDASSEKIVEVDLTHADPLVYVGAESEPYAPRFYGVRTKEDVKTLLRLFGTQPK